MGLKREINVKCGDSTAFAPYMGLKRMEVVMRFMDRLFAPYMGLKRSTKNGERFVK